MKKILIRTFLSLFAFLTLILIVLSTAGIETNKFNKLITSKILENNKDISLKIEKIKFKFDVKEMNLFLETKNPDLNFRNLNIPIKNIKIYFNFYSFIKSKPKIDKINISSKQINFKDLKKIILKTKPSNLNSLFINKVISGKIEVDLELFLENDMKIENFIATGEVKDMKVFANKDLVFKEARFNFFADKSDTIIKNISAKADGFLIKDGNLQIEKNKKIKIKTEFFSDVNINEKNIKKYEKYIKNFEYINNKTNFNGNLNHNLNLIFDNTFKIIDYTYIGKGKINESSIKFTKPIKSKFLNDDVNTFHLKKSELNIRYSSDKNNHIKSKGTYKINNQEYVNYDLKNNFLGDVLNINLNFEFKNKIKIDIINYNKDENKTGKIVLNFTKNKKNIYFKKIEYTENKNIISIDKLKINEGKLISFKKIKVTTFNRSKLNNDFSILFDKKIIIKGKKYDALNLNKILTNQTTTNPFKKINKQIDIDFKDVLTPLSKKIINFKLIGVLEKGKFVKISSKGDFGNNKFLDISLKSDKENKKKYLEVYSDLPQPLLSEYKFFQGLTGGNLLFSSIIEGDFSNSKMIIENFKVINAPGVVRLLSLADFGGLADLAEGEGLSFEKLEINMSNNKGFLRLEELFAVGPSISVLMEGYQEASGLISLRGTLVPAKNLNKILSKIPVIGNIIIPKDVGEGLFGVSFKIKGLPGDVKTSINPIKTLTPRFIIKALEKSKETK